MGVNIGSSLVRKATNLALNKVFKFKGRSGNFKFSRSSFKNFSFSDNNGNSRET